MFEARTRKSRGALRVLRDEFGLKPEKVKSVPHLDVKRVYKVLDRQGFEWDGMGWRRRGLPLYLRGCV